MKKLYLACKVSLRQALRTHDRLVLNSPLVFSAFVNRTLCLSIEGNDRDRTVMLTLFTKLAEKGFVTADEFISGYVRGSVALSDFNSIEPVLEMAEDLALDIPFTPKYLANYLGNVECSDFRS